MKYFTQELLDMMDKENSSEYKEAYSKWMSNLKKYWSIFESFKGLLPNDLVKLFSHSFHDAHIRNIIFQQSGYSYDIVLTMDSDSFCGELVHKGVSEYSTAISGVKNCGKIGDYRYGEILKQKAGWTHNFIFFNNSEILIKCEKLYWNTLDN